MRIPYPERVSIQHVVFFAGALFLIQLLEGTELYLCMGFAIFMLVAALAFNAAGGLTRASGAYVFFYSMLVVVVGICYKALLGEPAQKNLLVPRTDIEVYVGSIIAMYAAVVVSRRLSRKTGLLQNMLSDSKMHHASVGCMLFGAVAAFGIAALGSSATGIQTAFSQLNQLIALGIIIGVLNEIRRSGGTRCANPFLVAGTVYFFFLGATGFSKQGMITPLFCWLLPAAALGYRLSIVKVFGVLLASFTIFYYLVPFAQFGRGMIPENSTLSFRTDVAIRLLEHPNQTRSLYLKSEEEAAYKGGRGLNAYYDTPQGFWERLQFISVDDKLNDATNQGSIFGLLPVVDEFINTVPHFLWPDKPGGNFGNQYAHDINGEARDEGDTTTGISFSPTGEAYHLAGWTGILLIAPLLWCMFFTVWDSLLGDLRNTPWGLLGLALISHTAPEGGITGAIHLTTFGSEILIFCAFFAAWFGPIVATPILGPERPKIPPPPVSPPALAQH